jgi:hypothetical protein
VEEFRDKFRNAEFCSNWVEHDIEGERIDMVPLLMECKNSAKVSVPFATSL